MFLNCAGRPTALLKIDRERIADEIRACKDSIGNEVYRMQSYQLGSPKVNDVTATCRECMYQLLARDKEHEGAHRAAEQLTRKLNALQVALNDIDRELATRK